jgi:hypothetical protein
LFRARIDERNGFGRPEELIDLSGLEFEAVNAPDAALKWGGEPVMGRPLPREVADAAWLP